MPFLPGQSGNAKGGSPRSILNIKWEIIDQYVSDATKKAMSVVDGTDEDFKQITSPKERVDAKLKAIGHIIKLAPTRNEHSGPGGTPLFLPSEVIDKHDLNKVPLKVEEHVDTNSSPEGNSERPPSV